MSGLYCAIEGIDGSGKSTVIRAVADRIRAERPSLALRVTHHPGSTPLGAHIRQLNLHPEQIDQHIRISPLSGQLLMMVDHLSFVESVLSPSLAEGALVLADRCNFIGALAYGRAEGLDFETLDRLFRLVTSASQGQCLDRLYVLRLPQELARCRSLERGVVDRYESKGPEFVKRLLAVYNGLLADSRIAMVLNNVVSLQNVRYLDASGPLESVVDELTLDLFNLCSEAGI